MFRFIPDIQEKRTQGCRKAVWCWRQLQSSKWSFCLRQWDGDEESPVTFLGGSGDRIKHKYAERVVVLKQGLSFVYVGHFDLDFIIF